MVTRAPTVAFASVCAIAPVYTNRPEWFSSTKPGSPAFICTKKPFDPRPVTSTFVTRTAVPTGTVPFLIAWMITGHPAAPGFASVGQASQTLPLPSMSVSA
jgi:hypothetical protein